LSSKYYNIRLWDSRGRIQNLHDSDGHERLFISYGEADRALNRIIDSDNSVSGSVLGPSLHSSATAESRAARRHRKFTGVSK